MLVNIPYICMLQGLFTSSTCCSFPFFGVEGGALGFRWKSTICRFLWVVVFRANKAVWCCILKQTVQWNMDHISAVLVGLEAREILNIANVACRDLKNLMFFEISKRWTPPGCSERSVFRSTSPDLGPRSITGMVGLFSHTFWGRIRIPSSTRVWFFQGGTQVSKDIFSWYISQVTSNWYGKTCQKKSHLTSAFCVCVTPFVQGLAVSCRCNCPLQI